MSKTFEIEASEPTPAMTDAVPVLGGVPGASRGSAPSGFGLGPASAPGFWAFIAGTSSVVLSYLWVDAKRAGLDSFPCFPSQPACAHTSVVVAP